MNHHSDEIPVVQGTPVSYHNNNTQTSNSYAYTAAAEDGLWTNNNNDDMMDEGKIYSTAELRQQRQDPPQQYKDVAWAFAFGGQLVVMIGVCLYYMAAGTHASSGQQYNNNNNTANGSYGGLIGLVGVCGFLAIGLSSASLSFMANNAVVLVQAALIFSVGTSFLMGVVEFLVVQTYSSSTTTSSPRDSVIATPLSICIVIVSNKYVGRE